MDDEKRLSKWLDRTIKRDNVCWEWPGCVDKDGYPRALIIGYSRNLRIHRWIFSKINGYSPQVVRHTCDNTLCLNPEHLIGGTPTENMQDRSERGRTHSHIPDGLVKEVCFLKESGMTYKDIANKLNIKMKRAEYIWLRRRLVLCVES